MGYGIRVEVDYSDDGYPKSVSSDWSIPVMSDKDSYDDDVIAGDGMYVVTAVAEELGVPKRRVTKTFAITVQNVNPNIDLSPEATTNNFMI